jgi:hypothetical protein
MSRLKLSTGGVTARCSHTALLLIAFVAFTYSGLAFAQLHGAGVSKGCGPPVRICGEIDDPICDDGDACTEDICDQSNSTVMVQCVFEYDYNDEALDDHELIYAEDRVFAAGGDVVYTEDGNDEFGNPVNNSGLKIIAVEENASCAGTAPNWTLPCTVKAAAGVLGDGVVRWEQNIYMPTLADYQAVPVGEVLDQATVHWKDLCTGTSTNCNSISTNRPPGPSTSVIEIGCSSGPPFVCPPGDVCGRFECDPLGSTQDNCDIFFPVSATTECRASGGDCDVAESCDGINAACPADAKVSATTECRADGGECDVPESCDGINDACPADAKVSATTECRADSGDCDVAESCDGINDACPPDGFEPPGTICTDDGLNDCFEPLCDDAGNCTQDNEIIPPPDFCIEDEICRTPGFWKNRGGDEKNRPPGNITQAVITGAGGLDVCGFRITNTVVYPEAGWQESALEAMCISVKGDQQRQLIRQLTAAALNCEISGGPAGDCSQFHQDLIFGCNAICAANSDSQGMTDCIDAIDDFNNGLDAGGTCDNSAGTGSGDFCMDVGECTATGDTICVPNASCHDRSMCPDEDDGPIDGSDYCFVGGPTSSTGACKAASKNGIYLP